MNQSWVAVAGLWVLAAAPAATAGVGQGDFEAGVSISVSETTQTVTVDDGFGNTCEQESTSESGTIGGNVGFFVLDFLELKAAFSATRLGSESGGTCPGAGGTTIPSSTLGIFSPGLDFVFLGRAGTVAPFVGAAYGMSFGDTFGVDTDYFDVHGGAKFFIAERASLEVKLTRFEPTESTAGGRTELSAGINVYF